jgi:hypothetical protein
VVAAAADSLLLEGEAAVAYSCSYVAQQWLLLLLCCEVGRPFRRLLLLLSLLQHCYMLAGQRC